MMNLSISHTTKFWYFKLLRDKEIKNGNEYVNLQIWVKTEAGSNVRKKLKKPINSTKPTTQIWFDIQCSTKIKYKVLTNQIKLC